jgi:hypothetical protein
LRTVTLESQRVPNTIDGVNTQPGVSRSGIHGAGCASAPASDRRNATAAAVMTFIALLTG